jgi:phosphonate degradation operons associated HDIG domain protein
MIDKIFSIIRGSGHLTYGEDVTQLEHVLQCGHLAREDGAPDTLVAASLLHDIGQFIDDAGNAAEQRGVDARHESVGAAFLAKAFPDAVTQPVRLHVDAKRYLCAVEPGYREALSRASELSLQLQGGPMDKHEVAAFEQTPFFAEAIRLRCYDDAGKRQNWAVPELETYRPLLEGLMLRHLRQGVAPTGD